MGTPVVLVEGVGRVRGGGTASAGFMVGPTGGASHPLDEHAQAQARHNAGLAALGKTADGIAVLFDAFREQADRLDVHGGALAAAKTLQAGAEMVLAAVTVERAGLIAKLKEIGYALEVGEPEYAAGEVAALLRKLEGGR